MIRSAVAAALAWTLASVAASGVAGAVQPTTDAPRLYPVDEAATCPGFEGFRRDLLAAIRRRDEAALLRAVSPTVRLSFGAPSSVDEFRQLWLSPRPVGDIWEKLGRVLELGGKCENDTFIAPYVYAHWPNVEFDAFYYQAVIGDRVRLRAAPAVDAGVVAELSYDIVRTRDGAEWEAPWQPVETHDGRRGFVSRRYVRSPIDYRAYFSRTGGRWLMITFVAGD